jgi:hypothetical protein
LHSEDLRRSRRGFLHQPGAHPGNAAGAAGWFDKPTHGAEAIDPEHPYLAREFGVARYERLREADFTAATEYYARTRAFWDRVHNAWLDAFRHEARLTIRDPVDPEHGAYARLLDYADQLGTGQAANADEPGLIHAALQDVGAIAANQ